MPSQPRFDAVPENPFVVPMPKGFLWGVATSAHQVDGNTTGNDWARFERQPGAIAGGAVSGAAADHWNRLAEDTELIRRLGANAHRLSLEWSRLEPRPGRWDEAAWDHAEEELSLLHGAGIEPMLTLLHFTLPAWLAERGGLTAAEFPGRFETFAAEAGRRLGARVRLWCTVNEPNVAMLYGYVTGQWPPCRRDPALAAQAFTGLLQGHALAARALRREVPDARIGAAVHLVQAEPLRRWWLPDRLAAAQVRSGFNWPFYDAVRDGVIRLRLPGFPRLEEPLAGLRGSADFIGINYYRRNLVGFDPRAPGWASLHQGPGRLSDAGVELHPEGLLVLLREAWGRYGLPLIVTENGVADAGGQLRPTYLRAHAHALACAVAEGIPVQGYFHWTLLDNFEWTDGYALRFGLYRVDFSSQERIPTPGVTEFRRLAGLLRKQQQAQS
ncbi:MAG: family 1 glycosylhydrolase [Cyanobium sp. Prado107]|jgi:beta-glucosidase|nr:family 1 glycosylhydrolase [Cyanobium sp. Prado107]